MDKLSKKILINKLLKNKTVLTFWLMNRFLENKSIKNISKDYIKHIKKSVTLAIKSLPIMINEKLGKKSRKKSRKKKSNKQKGGMPPVIIYAGLLVLGGAYSLLSYDQHVTIEKTVRHVRKEFVKAGYEAIDNNHPHLAMVYGNIARNPFGNECQIYNPNQLTFNSANKNVLNTDVILKLPGTLEEQNKNKKKANDKAIQIYKDIEKNNGKNDKDQKEGLDNIIQTNNLNNVIDCHINNVLVAILAETQDIVKEIREEIGPQGTYDTLMNLFGLFINPNGIDTHIDNAMKSIDNINLKLNNKASDAAKLRNNMKIIFNKVTSLIKGGNLRINNANTAKHIIQATALTMVTGGSGTLANALTVAPAATVGIMGVSSALDIGSQKLANITSGPTITRLNGGKKKTKRKRKKIKQKTKRK
ncbi:MAG: hypothetical protein CML42_09535 [Rhodobacteraceae bacterium]|nr:hypothetical protein [Paracoccaceae bacterium]|tara:strand:- start:7359 stop:8609 length:1251 start_codon:yes stop_codon:yes gene_type:complete